MMVGFSRRFGLLLLPLVCLAACATTPTSRPPSRRAATRPAPPPPRPTTPAPAPQTPDALYGANEALRDAISSSWEYVDTGPWPGSNRTQACVFRNERVLLVNTYCTLEEVPASRIDVYSPTRGHVRIYAETSGPISERTRDDYFTFMVESEPPPGPRAQLPPLSLDMTFDELYAYEQQRYEAYLPSCYGGEQMSRRKLNCQGSLDSHATQWAERHRGFLQSPGAAWYHVLRKTRSLAQHYGAAAH